MEVADERPRESDAGWSPAGEGEGLRQRCDGAGDKGVTLHFLCSHAEGVTGGTTQGAHLWG